jgi:hypothetical protein
VFFVVGSGATLGDNSDFIGNILALDQIAFDPGATDLCGRALSKTASVTFAGQNPTTGEQNEVSIGCSAVAIGGGGSGGGLGGGTTGVAEPSTLSLLLGDLISFGFLSKRLLLS